MLADHRKQELRRFGDENAAILAVDEAFGEFVFFCARCHNAINGFYAPSEDATDRAYDPIIEEVKDGVMSHVCHRSYVSKYAHDA